MKTFRPSVSGRLTTAILAVVLISLAACSSTAASKGDAKSVIKIGYIAEVTGPESPGTNASVTAAQARVKATNAAGGVAGHRLDLIVTDDQSTPQGALAAAQSLVSQGVVGVLSTGTVVEGAAQQYLSENGIPMAAIDADPATIADPNVYSPLGSSGPSVPANASLGQFLSGLGVTKVAGVAWGDAAAAVSLMEAPLNAAQAVGVKTVLRDLSPTLTTVDFIPDALKIKSSGAQAVFAAMATSSDVALAQAMAQQSVRLKAQVYAATVYEQAETAQPALNGAYIQAWFAPVELNTSAVRQYVSTLDRYARGTFGGLHATLAYVDTDLLVAGLQAITSGSYTAKSLGAAIRTLRHYTGAGLIPRPIDFAVSNTNSVNLQRCYWYPRIKNGQFVITSSKPVCG
jgi:ABC-type branched-subunit amino acid transport system substrate-binding protein